jgi:hypothetical protein
LAKAFPVQYDRERANRAFEILLRTKGNELKQIAQDIGYPTSGQDWENKILLFCFDIDKCFNDLSLKEVEDGEVLKCMNLMRMIANHKTLNEVQKIQILAYNIAQDFKVLYEKQT